MIDMQAIRQDVLEVFQEHKTVKGIWDIKEKLNHKYYKHEIARAFWILYDEGHVVLGNDFKLYIKE
jgi:hypothetical protein